MRPLQLRRAVEEGIGTEEGGYHGLETAPVLLVGLFGFLERLGVAEGFVSSEEKAEDVAGEEISGFNAQETKLPKTLKDSACPCKVGIYLGLAACV